MSTSADRSSTFIWWVCGLLLLASTINYMDRQTLSNTTDHIKRDFDLNNEQLGLIETAFSLAFAVGATIFGVIADRTSVRWLYPTVLLLWSAMGFATGLVETYAQLLGCRLMLGLFEAGHWPCALKTTQRLLPSSKRTLGNSVLQSGTAIGAMVTPLIIKALMTKGPDGQYIPGSWRPAFQIIGAIGVVWAVLWLLTVWNQDLEALSEETSRQQSADSSVSFWNVIRSRKFVTLMIVVIAINICWHQFRFWMKQFLVTGRGFNDASSLNLIFWFNVMTDIGCLVSGAVTAILHRNGLTPHASRCLVFSFCASLVAVGAVIPWVHDQQALIAVLMVVGLGALGMFPCYYSFTQELSVTHQGKVSGTLGTIAWIFPALWHWQFGRWVDYSKSYDMGMCIASLMPLIGVFAILTLWPREVIEEA